MSDVIRIEPGRLGVTLVRDQKRRSAAVTRGLEVAKLRAVALLKSLTPVDQGIMRAAWAPSLDGVKNTAPHAGIIERGARPHAVSREGIEAITQWVIRHAHLFKDVARAKRRRKRDGGATLESEARSIAWAIAAKLKREGQKGHFIVENNLERLVVIVQECVMEALASASRGGGQ